MGSLPFEDIFSPLDTTSFTNESKMVVDFIANYYKNIETYPVRSQVKPGFLNNLLPSTASDYPESLESICNDVSDSIIPGISHWQSPNFFVGFSWISSPAATELESIVMDWMGKMLKLPSSFLFSGTGGGVLLGSNSEAIVCTLAAARDKALKKYGEDKITKLVVYGSDQTHSTVHKGAKLVGIPPSNFRALPTFSSDFSLSPETLRSQIETDMKSGLIPLFLCATEGTTSSGAVDPLMELGKIANEYDLWYHIDAAYAGSACICPEFGHHLDGVELANSLSMNLHKWFLINLDCSCLWISQPKTLTDFLSNTPEYLRSKASESEPVIDYKDWKNCTHEEV